MLCLSCKTNEATIDSSYGILDCSQCRAYHSHRAPVEIIPDSLKTERKKYKNATVQPFRKGVLSKEYIEQYGTKGINVTKEEVKRAKRVWDSEYYD